jgi:hypothetical protein
VQGQLVLRWLEGYVAFSKANRAPSSIWSPVYTDYVLHVVEEYGLSATPGARVNYITKVGLEPAFFYKLSPLAALRRTLGLPYCSLAIGSTYSSFGVGVNNSSYMRRLSYMHGSQQTSLTARDSLQLSHCFLVLVVQSLAELGYTM